MQMVSKRMECNAHIQLKQEPFAEYMLRNVLHLLNKDNKDSKDSKDSKDYKNLRKHN